LISIFNACFSLCKFTELQQSIIYLYQSANKDFYILKNKEIAEILEVKENTLSDNISFICTKLCKAYETIFTEYYYTFLVKGKYKRCTKCGQNKITQDFYEGRNNNLRSICKDCTK
jgi:hypothetical protein